MNPPSYADFASVAAILARELKQNAPRVRTERWQGRDVSRDPAATTYEILNACFAVDLQGIEDLDHWRDDIRPNLPWADDHFAERVGGRALNPGEEWKRWPWAGSAARFTNQTQEIGPRFAPQDWAYLAGMIDGDGTVDPRSDKLPVFQGRVSVGQKDRAVLDYICGKFKVGKVHQMPPRNAVLNGKVYDEPTHMWTVYGSANVRWIITNCLPYFVVKKVKAEEMIATLDEGDKLAGSTKSHRETVWGRDWPGRFRANYMDRFWPRQLEGSSNLRGIEGRYGDLNDLVALLAREPHTRQAWFPVFHPDETGAVNGGRVMCTLGYQVMVRETVQGPRAHMYYPLRSCDFVRHWRDDCYLAVRLLIWIIEQCRVLSPERWAEVRPGQYAMHMTSLHIFENDRRGLLT